jgi:hypothetical protein
VFFFDEDYEYSRSYVRYSSNFDTVFSTAAYVKMNYWTAWSGYVQPASGAGWPTSLTVKIYADTEYLPLPYTWEGERWICVEARANLDSGTIEVWIDGESIGIHSGTFYTEGGPANWQLGIVNACPMPAGSYTMWADSATISKSRIYPATIVEVGDSSNYETANKNKQVLEKAGDEQIEFVLDTTGLGVGPYYVWVTNNRQERSLAWVEDTASDTTPPSHPTGLSVD